MCYSSQVSFTVWVVVLIVSALLLIRGRPNDKWNAMFILCFTIIQLLEGLIWSRMDRNITTGIATITAIILIALWSQPLVQTYMGYRTTGSKILYYGTILFVALLGYAIYRAVTGNFTTIVGPNGHLVWIDKNNKSFLSSDKTKFLTIFYLMGLLGPLLFMKGIWQKTALIGYGLATLLYSIYNYSNTEEMSSMWCFIACGYSLVALITG